jgi:hypothetical protein
MQFRGVTASGVSIDRCVGRAGGGEGGVVRGAELCTGHVGSRAADVTSPWLRLEVFAKATMETRQQAYRSLNRVSPHSSMAFLSQMYPTESGLGVSERRSGSG